VTVKHRLLLLGVTFLLLVTLRGAGGASAHSQPGPVVKFSQDSAQSCVSFPGQHICSTTHIISMALTFPSGDVAVATQSRTVLTGQFADCQTRSVTRQGTLGVTTKEGVPLLDTDVFMETTRGTCAPLNCTVLNVLVAVRGDVKINSSQLSCHA
jgi:hypothetical protein